MDMQPLPYCGQRNQPPAEMRLDASANSENCLVRALGPILTVNYPLIQIRRT
jgi:hypothetical protein